MKRSEAKKLGQAVGREILTFGDFTPAERADEYKFRQAFYEIVENRKQYAGDVTEELKTDEEWDAFEEGLNIALERYCKKHYWISSISELDD